MNDEIKQDLAEVGLSDRSDQEAVPALAAFLSLLQRWNGTYNLSSIRDPEQMRIQHLLDCLAVIPTLRSLFDTARPLRVLDVGSGGGLPGVVLAILNPHWSVDCIDAVGKKSAFIRQVAGQLGLKNLRGIHGRVENLRSRASYDLIISRAFSSLDNFIQLTEALLAPQGVWAAMKGKHPTEEIAKVPGFAKLKAIETIKIPGNDSSRCLVLYEGKH